MLGELFRPSRPDFIETSAFQLRRRTGKYCSGLPGRTSLRQDDEWEGREKSTDCSGLPGRTSLRRRCRVGNGTGLRPLFRPSRPDFIETFDIDFQRSRRSSKLFRPSRPDFIETCNVSSTLHTPEYNCSGLPGRTSLRRDKDRALCEVVPALFRPSRPDFIETWPGAPRYSCRGMYCSGLPGRTSLRRLCPCQD